MKTVRIGTPTEEQIQTLVKEMRDDDALEISRAGFQTVYEGVSFSVDTAERAYAVTVGGDLLAICGVRRHGVLQGLLFALTTYHVESHRSTFLRLSRVIVDSLGQGYTTLMGFVDEDYTRAHRWLNWLGFDLTGPVPYGLHSHPFYVAIRR